MKNLKRYGIHPLSVHWQSKYTQYKRFEILTNFIKTEIKTSSIIDAGSGLGDYYIYLEENNLKPSSYLGLDMEEEMIKIAKKRFLNISFEKKDILSEDIPEVDYYVCSGAMNILKKEEMFAFIDKCYRHSKKGFAFNFLKQDSFNKVSVNEVISHCKEFCFEIRINSSYLENDISIFLKK